jgi:hypothetical protein
MVRKAEIVVGAEQQNLPVVNDDTAPLLSLHKAKLSIQPLRFQCFEFGSDLFQKGIPQQKSDNRGRFLAHPQTVVNRHSQ